MNVFVYASACEKAFENYFKSIGSDYERKTTFYSDLSIAEYVSGAKGIKETYNNVMKSWIDNIEYITEFAMSLNLKSWQMSEEGKEKLMNLYAELYYKAKDKIYDYYGKKEGANSKSLEYFFNTTD